MPLPELDQLVSRPVVYAVLEQIKAITSIPRDTDITFIGQGGSRHHFAHSESALHAPVKLSGERMLTVEVDEQPDEGLFTGVAGNRPEHQPDFKDWALGVELKPIYCAFDYVVTCTYRTSSRSEAIRWRNDARHKASQSRTVNLHELEYSYQVPSAAMELLVHVHGLRESHCGYGEDFEEWLSRCFTSRVTRASTVVGTGEELLVREKQFRVQGAFDFTHAPERQERSEGNGWEVRFTYTFSFHKPVEYSARYPVVVHNRAIDRRFIPLLPIEPTESDKRMSLSMNAMHYMEEPVMLRRTTGYESVTYSPAFDGWSPDVQLPGQRLFASFLLGLDDGYQGPVLNLSRLGDYHLDPSVLEWITKEEYRFMHLPHTSAVQVQLYRQECLSAPQAIEVHANGDVVLLEKADGRKRYRLTLSVVTKLHLCDPRSLVRLARYPQAACKLIALTRTTTGEIYQLLPYVNLERHAHCASSGGLTRAQAVLGFVSPKTVMQSAVLASRLGQAGQEGPAEQLMLLHPHL